MLRTHTISSAQKALLGHIPIVACLILLGYQGLLGAQSVADPRVVDFSPSADHDTQLPGGAAAVTSYTLEVYQAGAAQPFHTVDMGKPEPGTDGRVRFDFSTGVSGWPLPGGVYEARVSAVGPYGQARSEVSNPFTMSTGSGTCSTSLSTYSLAVGSAATSGTLTITTRPGCPWNATSGDSWVTVIPATGSGAGTVAYTVAANETGVSRSTTLTIGGKKVNVTQAGISCTYSVSPLTVSVDAGGASATLTVNATAGCSWSASSSAAWVTLSPSSGSGGEWVTLTVSANSSASPRSVAVNVAGQVVTVNQASAPCSYSVSPATVSVDAGTGSAALTVSAGPGCAWTASSSAPWVTVSPASGSGTGWVTVAVAANGSTAPRSTTLTAAGRTVTVSQAGAACNYTVSPGALLVDADGGGAALTVTAEAGCSWTVSSSVPWATVSPESGSGNGSVTVTVGANTAAAARSTTVTVAEQAVTVNQAGVSCSYTVSPATVSAAVGGGNATITVTTADCSWTASSSAGWVTASPESGNGSGSVTLSVAANVSAGARRATVAVAGQTVTVNQPGSSCSYSVSPTTLSVAAGGGNPAVAVTTQTGCDWTAASGAGWVSVAPTSATGRASAIVSIASNPSTSPRTTTLAIAGQVVVINQAGGASCTYSVSPASINLAASGAPVNVSVSTQAGCAWMAQSSASWVTLSAPSGNGGSTLVATIAPNGSSSSRTATLTVAGQIVKVNQAAGSCAYTLSTTRISLPAGGGSGMVKISTAVGCTWSAASVARWVTVSPATGSGTAWVTVTVPSNGTALARSAAVTLGGQSVTIEQADLQCSYSVAPSSLRLPARGGAVTIDITTATGCQWTAADSATWLSLSVGAGAGRGSLTVTASPNQSGTTRSATVMVAGSTVTVDQTPSAVPSAPRGVRILSVR